MRLAAKLPLALALLGACGTPSPWGDGDLGAVSLAAVGSAHDVAHVAFSLVEPGGDCTTGPVVASATVALHPAALDGHRFGETSFVIGAGDYLACAAPLQSDTSPSLECAPASANVAVTEGQTTVASLVSQCTASAGGVDFEVALNEPPVIDGVQVSPSKFIESCESATLAVTASDPEDDALSYSWAVTEAPLGATPVLTPAANTATFGGDLAGDYTVTVTASDIHGASVADAIPMHVSVGTCTTAGSVEWMVWGGSTEYDAMTAVAIAPSGNIFATAAFYSTVDFGLGVMTGNSRDGAILEMTPTGALVAQRQLTEDGFDEPLAIAVDAAGSVFVGGNFSLRLDLGCGQRIGAGAQDAFVAKLASTTGACLWNHTFGGSGNDHITALAVDPAGNVVVGGHFGSTSITIPGGSTLSSQGQYDVFYASFDDSGGYRWSHAAGGSGQDRLYDLDIDAAGDVVLAGSIGSATITFDPGMSPAGHQDEDMFVGKLSGGTGDMSHLLVPLATGHDRARSVAFDPIGDVVVGFELGGTVDLGGGPLVAPGQRDVVVARLRGEDLAHDWSVQFFSGAYGSVSQLVVDAEGDVRLVGDFNTTITFGGTTLAASALDDVFVASLNGIHGGAQWAISGGSIGGDDEGMPALAVDASGATYAAGRFGNYGAPGFVLGNSSPLHGAGSWDAFLAKLAK